MASRAIFEADSPDELRELLERMVSGNRSDALQANVQTKEREPLEGDVPRSKNRPTYIEFKRARPQIAQEILDLFERNDGRYSFRSLEKAFDIYGTRMGGTLGALEHAAYNAFGCHLLLPQPWTPTPDGGPWDRFYTLNPNIYP